MVVRQTFESSVQFSTAPHYLSIRISAPVIHVITIVSSLQFFVVVDDDTVVHDNEMNMI